MSSSVLTRPIPFVLPKSLEAAEPPEARGLARDEVRLMTSFMSSDAIVHTRFTHFADFLHPGDVLVVNTSATLNAAVPAVRADGTAAELHLSQGLPDGTWVVELRRPTAQGTKPVRDARAGEVITLPAGATVTLLQAYRGSTRLWRALLSGTDELLGYLDKYGFPIRYGYVKRSWPLEYYQTMFAQHPGSAEMPSAGRAFTQRVLDAVMRKGVRIAPILLHTGVSSLEEHEPPYPEFFRVSAASARIVNAAHAHNGRVIAVGTTAVRALESVATADGAVTAGHGWTDLVIGAQHQSLQGRERGLRIVDALLTGFHEPQASHIAMLEALAGQHHIEQAYGAALEERYLWHEFGDLHLIL